MPPDVRDGGYYLPGTPFGVLAGLHAMLCPIGFLRADPTNPRTQVNIQVLMDGIKAFGVRSPVVVNRRTGVIEAGHQRVDALRRLGAQHVPVVWADDDHSTARAFMISDNRVGETVAVWDEDALGALLRDLNAEDEGLLDALGFEDDELLRLLAGDGPGTSGSTAPPKSDLADQLQAQWGTKVGDLWAVGPHRILCGDCTDALVVRRLFGERRADSLIADPPYGVDYVTKNQEVNADNGSEVVGRPIANDAIKDYRAFFSAFLRAALLTEYNTTYIFMSDRELHHLRLAMEDTGFTCAALLVWLKNRIVFSRADYHYRHEYLAYGWRGKHEFYGDAKSCGILEFDKPQDSDMHPTMKPVELIERLVRDGSPPGGLIYDPFLGSGTTLLAAHAAGRTCFACEVDPAYVAVSLERARESLGVQPERVEVP